MKYQRKGKRGCLIHSKVSFKNFVFTDSARILAVWGLRHSSFLFDLPLQELLLNLLYDALAAWDEDQCRRL